MDPSQRSPDHVDPSPSDSIPRAQNRASSPEKDWDDPDDAMDDNDGLERFMASVWWGIPGFLDVALVLVFFFIVVGDLNFQVPEIDKRFRLTATLDMRPSSQPSREGELGMSFSIEDRLGGQQPAPIEAVKLKEHLLSVGATQQNTQVHMSFIGILTYEEDLSSLRHLLEEYQGAKTGGERFSCGYFLGPLDALNEAQRLGQGS